MTLPGFDPVESISDATVRHIFRTRDSYVEDLDKLRERLHAGGTFLEMRAAVDAFAIIDNIVRELEKVAARAKTEEEEIRV